MRRLTQEVAEERVMKRCKEMNYELVEPFIYNGNTTRISLKCNIDGYEWTSQYYNFIQNKNCPKCGGSLKRTQKEAEKLVNEKCIEKNYTLREPFIYTNKGGTILKLRCLNDFYEWDSVFHDFIYGDYGCTRCANSEKYTQEIAEQKVLKRCNEMGYELVKPFIYTNNKIKLEIKCTKHNVIFYPPFTNLTLNISGCPCCSSSKGELRIIELLKKCDIDFNHQKRFNGCKDKKQLPFDFYLPHSNTCIEFDGKQHHKIVEKFGGKEGLKDRQRKDKIKDNYCKDNNIKLIRIRYDENIEEKLKENTIIP